MSAPEPGEHEETVGERRQRIKRGDATSEELARIAKTFEPLLALSKDVDDSLALAKAAQASRALSNQVNDSLALAKAASLALSKDVDASLALTKVVETSAALSKGLGSKIAHLPDVGLATVPAVDTIPPLVSPGPVIRTVDGTTRAIRELIKIEKESEEHRALERAEDRRTNRWMIRLVALNTLLTIGSFIFTVVVS